MEAPADGQRRKLHYLTAAANATATCVVSENVTEPYYTHMPTSDATSPFAFQFHCSVHLHNSLNKIKQRTLLHIYVYNHKSREIDRHSFNALSLPMRVHTVVT